MSEKSNIQSDFMGDLKKHEARLKLWLPALQDLRNKLGRPLRYFTFPGEKAYDVIAWKQKGLIEFNERGFPNVCFCEMKPEYFANATRILKNTIGVPAKFEDVINNRQDSKYKPFWVKFPYDVYNLDFCGTCFESNRPLLNKTFLSIIRLINAHISKNGSGKFLLLLTVRIDKNYTNEDFIKNLVKNLESNRKDSDFSLLINGLVKDEISNFIEERFCDFIMTGLPKILASKIRSQTRETSGRIEDLYRAYYKRRDRENNYDYFIGKFVFLIDKEATSFESSPSWYRNVVVKSLDLVNIMKINESNISNGTQQDLDELKREIRDRENYL